MNYQTNNKSLGNDNFTEKLYKYFTNEHAPALLNFYGLAKLLNFETFKLGTTWHHECYFYN